MEPVYVELPPERGKEQAPVAPADGDSIPVLVLPPRGHDGLVDRLACDGDWHGLLGLVPSGRVGTRQVQYFSFKERPTNGERWMRKVGRRASLYMQGS